MDVWKEREQRVAGLKSEAYVIRNCVAKATDAPWTLKRACYFVGTLEGNQAVSASSRFSIDHD